MKKMHVCVNVRVQVIAQSGEGVVIENYSSVLDTTVNDDIELEEALRDAVIENRPESTTFEKIHESSSIGK